MSTETYTPPVSELLSYGNEEVAREKEREPLEFDLSKLFAAPSAQRGTSIDPESFKIIPPDSSRIASPFSVTTSNRGSAPKKEKNKRKMAKLSRKKNKRKK